MGKRTISSHKRAIAYAALNTSASNPWRDNEKNGQHHGKPETPIVISGYKAEHRIPKTQATYMKKAVKIWNGKTNSRTRRENHNRIRFGANCRTLRETRYNTSKCALIWIYFFEQHVESTGTPLTALRRNILPAFETAAASCTNAWVCIIVFT